VPVVDDIALDNDRTNTFAELGPIATDARLFDEQLESIKDGVDESIGGRWAGSRPIPVHPCGGGKAGPTSSEHSRSEEP
jgi:hypothetical protein